MKRNSAGGEKAGGADSAKTSRMRLSRPESGPHGCRKSGITATHWAGGCDIIRTKATFHCFTSHPSEAISRPCCCSTRPTVAAQYAVHFPINPLVSQIQCRAPRLFLSSMSITFLCQRERKRGGEEEESLPLRKSATIRTRSRTRPVRPQQ